MSIVSSRTAICLLLTAVFAMATVTSQTVPQSVNFQAVARMVNGDPIALKAIRVKLSIATDSIGQALVYSEEHDVQTDDLGLFTIQLGRGTTNGRLSDVPWGAQSLWLLVYVNLNGQSSGSYLQLGSQRIVSVPYSFHADESQLSDTANVARSLVGVLQPAAGGTGSSQIPPSGGVAYGDGTILRYTPPGSPGMLLVATGQNAPEWRTLSSMIDSILIHQITEQILRDSTFLTTTTNTVREQLTSDSTFILSLARDTILRREVELFVDSILHLRPEYERIRDSLLADRFFADSMYTHTRTRLYADTSFTSFVGVIVEELLSGLIKPSWLLSGNTGTNPNTNFIGTTDRQALVFRTSNTERLRVTELGNVGINTNNPATVLDVNGNLTLRGDLRMEADPGASGMVLMSKGPGILPDWTSDLALDNLIVRDTARLATTLVGGSSLTVNSPSYFRDNVRFADTVRFDVAPILPLSPGYMLYGNASSIATPLAPGLNGSVLSIIGGMPRWVAAPPNMNAQNGIVWTGAFMELGGDLIRHTQISTRGFNVAFTGTGNVGVGTVSPQQKLDVAGNVQFSGSLMPGGSAGVSDRLLASRGPNAPPVWVDTLRSMTLIDPRLSGNITFNGSTTLNAPLTVNSSSTFNGAVTFNQLPRLPLQRGNIWVGDALNVASPFAPGTNGQYLSVQNGDLVWRSVPSFADPSINFTGLSVTISPTTSVVFRGPVTFERTIRFDSLPSIPLADQHLLIGSSSNIAVPFGPGISGDVLSIGPNGKLQWSSVSRPSDSVIVFTADTVRFSDTTLVNIGNNVLVLGDTTLIVNPYTAITGDTLLIANTFTQVSSQTTVFDGQAVNFSDTTIVNFGGPVTFDSTVIFASLPEIPLEYRHLLIGSSTNIAVPFAPGSPRQVLGIDSAGNPRWTDVSLADDSVVVFTSDTVRFSDTTTVIFDGPVYFDSTVTFSSDTVRYSDTTNVYFDGPVSFDSTVVFAELPTLPLPSQHLLAGDATNTAVPFAPGAPQQVLSIDPLGLLVWRDLVEPNDSVIVFTADTVRFSDTTNVFFDGPVIFDSTVVFTELPVLPLQSQHLLAGDVTNIAAPFAPGAPQQVLSIDPLGQLIWRDLVEPNDSVIVFTSDTIRFSDTTNVIFEGPVVFDSTVIFTELPTLPLLSQHLIAGDATNTAVPFAPGAPQQVLSIDPLGLLVWRDLVEPNDSVIVFTADTVRFSDTTNVYFEGPVVFDSTVIFTELPSLPIPDQHLLAGDATNTGVPFAPGTPDQVLSIDALGQLVWRDVTEPNDSVIIFTADTVRFSDTTNVYFEGPVVFDSTVIFTELPSLPLPAQHLLAGDATNTGVPFAPGMPDQVLSIDALGQLVWRDVTEPNDSVIVFTADTVRFSDTTNVYFEGPVVFDSTVIFTQLPELPLQLGNVLVGNALNIATPLPPGANGSVFIVSGGVPSWQPPSVLGEFWNVGGTASPSSPILGNMTLGGSLNLYAGGVQRIALEGMTGDVTVSALHMNINGTPGTPNVRVQSVGGAPSAAPLGANESIIVADVNGDLRKVSVSAVVPATATMAGSVIVPSGATLVTVVDPNITGASRIVITMEDVTDSGFILCQVVSKAAGSFNVRLSAPPTNATTRINYLFSNP